MNSPLIVPVEDHSAALALATVCGAAVSVDGCGAQLAPASTAVSPDLGSQGWITPIADLGLLRVEGEDSVGFLHAQLTNDMENLGPNGVRLAGYCSAKGRLLATALCWRTGDAILILAPQPLLSGLRKRLSMFVLRSRVRITDLSGEWSCFGVGGSDARGTVVDAQASWPEPMAVSANENSLMLGLPAVAVPAARSASATGAESKIIPRAILLCPNTHADQHWRKLAARLIPVPSTFWRWTEVVSGTPRIVAATIERFIPQMVNLDLIGGVSFRKGCYPGQEVVARSHYLGKLKRRMFLAHVEGSAPEPGTDVLGPESEEPCGQVVLSAPAPTGGAHVLFESQIAAAAKARLVDGRGLTLVELPYALGN